MLGLVLTLLFCALVTVAGALILTSTLVGRSRATVLGLGGLLGLGFPGIPMLILGPKGALIGVIGLGFWSAISVRQGARFSLHGIVKSLPRGLAVVSLIPFALLILCGAVGALAPSNAADWDTIAYHLAVPKVWLSQGNMVPLSFIHHSFFPASVDALFVLGLQWGGQAGAKAFTLAYSVLGGLALWGLAKDRFGDRAAAWTIAVFASIPVAIWESGTGYIDVAHGLYAGLGAYLVFVAIEGHAPRIGVLGGALLGLAAGSKYTGLQALIGIGLVVVALMIVRRNARKPFVAAAAIVAVVVAAPWYIRNAAVSGNPVYPFFFEQLGGKWWSQHQADIYRFEQKTFGVPVQSPIDLPHSILGLSYQPGRYINPGQRLEVVDGQPRGATGNPLGATGPFIGFAILIALAFRRSIAKTGLAVTATLAWIILGLLMWAFLSQQSRYMLSFAPPLAILAGGLMASARLPRWIPIAGATLLVTQASWTGWLAKDRLLGPDRLRAALGVVSEADYLRQTLAFYEAAEYLNRERAKRVALFDEVFGFYLDIPYFWAGYGHTNEMDYEHMDDAARFVQKLKELGIDRVYVSLAFSDRAFVERWVGSMGIQGSPVPLREEERRSLEENLEGKWKVFLADAVAAGQLQPEKAFRGGLLFRLSE